MSKNTTNEIEHAKQIISNLSNEDFVEIVKSLNKTIKYAIQNKDEIYSSYE